MKTNRTLIILLVALLCGLSLMGKRPKSLSEGLRPAIEKPSEQASIAVPRPPRNLKVVQKDDTIYCIGTVQGPGGWQLPLGRLTKEQAEKSNFSVRLSNVNKKGHYGRLECVGYNLKPVPYTLQFSIFERVADSLINLEFPAAPEISRLDMLSDATGDIVVEARYYDTGNNPVVYEVNQQLPNLPKVWLTRYFSPVGLPMNPLKNGINILTYYSDDGKSFEHFLYSDTGLVIDKNGEYGVRESIDFEAGYVDKTFLNNRREPMLGGSGYTTERKYYNSILDIDSIVYLDMEGNKMDVMADAADKGLQGVAKRIMCYNERHQLTKERNFDKHDRPTANGYGTHYITHKHDPMGNQIEVAAYTIDGKPTTIEGKLHARWETKFDSLGRWIESHEYDTKGQPVGSSSSSYQAFSPSGEQISYRNYVAENGIELLSSSLETLSDGSQHYLFDDGTHKYISYDKRGRVTSSRFVDSKGKPDTTVDVATSEYFYTTDKAGNVCSVNNDYDPLGRLISSHATDSLKHICILKDFDTDGHLINHYGRQYDDEWDAMKHYDMLNTFGVRVRRGDIDMPQFLRLTFDRTIGGDYYNMRAVDEFGEPDYMVYSDWSISAGKDINTSADRPYHATDEDGNIIKDMDEMKRLTPKYMSIEVLDSTAYRLGLKDNDVILSYGPNYRPKLRINEESALGDWAIASTFNADTTKDITVFRIESTEPERCRILTLPLPKGTIRELGFTAHLTYKTRRQQARIDSCGGVPEISVKELPDSVACAVVPRMFLHDRYTPYAEAVGTPSMLVGVEVMELPHIRWTHGDDMEKLLIILGLNDGAEQAPFHIRKRYFNGKECIDECRGDSVETKSSLRFLIAGVNSAQKAKITQLAKDFTPGEAIVLPDSLKGAAGVRLYELEFYDDALPLLEAGATRGEKYSLRFLTLYYKHQKKDMAKAAEFAKKAATIYEQQENMGVGTKLSLAKLYAYYDPEKAGRYLGKCIREIEISRESPMDERKKAILELLPLFGSIAEYCEEGSEAYIDGAIYAGLKAMEIGLKDSIVVERYFSKAAKYGRLKAEEADATAAYYLTLVKCLPRGEQFHRLLDEFLADKVGIFRIIEEAGRKAYDSGLRGEYTIVRYGDWDILSEESWNQANERLRDNEKHIVLLSDKGKIIEMDIEGPLGATFEFKIVSPKERAKILKLLERYKK